MAASPVAAISAAPAPPSTSKTCPAAPATPMGLRTGGGPEASVGAKALPRTHAAVAAAAAPAAATVSTQTHSARQKAARGVTVLPPADCAAPVEPGVISHLCP